MKEELDLDYDISAENILNMTKDQEIGDFKLITSEFYSEKGIVERTILSNEKEQKQIFSMQDGRFVLEVEEDGMVEYYFSNDIKELL